MVESLMWGGATVALMAGAALGAGWICDNVDWIKRSKKRSDRLKVAAYVVPLGAIILLAMTACTNPKGDPGVRGSAIAPPAHYYVGPGKLEPVPQPDPAFQDRLIHGGQEVNNSGVTIKRRRTITIYP